MDCGAEAQDQAAAFASRKLKVVRRNKDAHATDAEDALDFVFARDDVAGWGMKSTKPTSAS